MAENFLQKVLERAFNDQQFRSRLESDLDHALKDEGYDLSSEERLQLKGILDEGKESFATGLDQRLSQSGVSLSPQALLRQKSKSADKKGGLLHHQDTGAVRKQSVRQALASESSFTGEKHSENRSRETIDDGEPDYEVETD